MRSYNEKILNSETELREWFAESGDTYSFDTETNGQQYSTLVARSFQLCNGKAVAFVPVNEEIIKVFRELFLSIKTIICHNITYDMKVCKKYNIPFEHIKLYDTMVAQHLIDEESELGLKYLTFNILEKQEVIHWEDVTNLDVLHPKFVRYAMDDVINTWELAQWQQQPMKEQGLVTLFREIEMPFMLCIIDMETNGILIDKEQVNETTLSLQKKTEELCISMHDMLKKKYDMQFDLFGNCNIVSDLNFNSSQQLSQILFKELGLPQTVTTEAGQPSVGKEAIETLKGKHPFVDLLIQYKIAQKLLNAFFTPLPVFIEQDGRVRAHFNDCGTATGRLSCTKPNLQQLPKLRKEFPIDTRKCFIVEEDEVMISADYSSQELRVLAEITQEKNLIDSFNKGKDLHLATANEFFNLGIPEAALYENGEEHETYKKKFKGERDKAKCFHPDTQVLTKLGWKRILEINTQTEIIQAVPTNGGCTLSWVLPTEVFSQYHPDNKLVYLENESTSLLVTPDHRMLAFNTKGEHYVTTPYAFNDARYWCNAGGLLDDIIDVTDYNFIRLVVATQADGSYTKTNIRFGFTKKRKIERMDEILSSFPRRLWSKTKPGNVTTYRIFGELCSKIKELVPDKIFTYELLELGYLQREQLIDELKYWDSHENEFHRSFTYASVLEINHDVIQALCSITNRKTYKRHNHKCWITTIMDRATTRGGNLKIKDKVYMDKVACLSVPSTFVLVRYNGKTTITGQTVNFGIAYGKGAFGFAQDFRTSEDEAQKILDRYFSANPKVHDAINAARTSVQRDGYVTSITGRRRRFKQQKDDKGNTYYTKASFRQAFNFLIQGYSADMIRIASINCYKLKKLHPEWNLKLLATVHDELLLSCSKKYEKVCISEIKNAFETAVTLSVPLISSVVSGKNYSECK